MRLGNTGGKNLGKKYLKIKGDEPIIPENQAKADQFNYWFSREYVFLKKKIISQEGFCSDDILHETYLKMYNKILFGGLVVKNYAMYFHRAYYTNKMLSIIKDNKFIHIEPILFSEIDESEINIEIMKEQDLLMEQIKDFVKAHYPEDYALFVDNMINGISYPELSKKTGLNNNVIQRKIHPIKTHLKEVFADKISIPHKNMHTANTPSIVIKKDEKVPEKTKSIKPKQTVIMETANKPTVPTAKKTETDNDVIFRLITEKKVVPYSMYEDLLMRFMQYAK